MSEIYVHPAVNTAALNHYFRNSEEHGSDIHTLQIWKDGQRLLRIAPAPYSCDDKAELYSLSKSFVSTAFGLAFDRGLIRPEDRVIDLFPESLPEKYDPNLEKVTFSHVLSMNSGHSTCVMPKMFMEEDPVKAFFSQPFPYEPGTHFAYNTGCSCLVSSAIRKVTGMNAMDYLQTFFFTPLDMENMIFNTVYSGINEGGIGIQASSDDIAKLGLLYLNKGVYNGKRILSEEWVDRATKAHSDNSGNGSKDWCAGYGYQFWRCAEGGYRGDGACGQLCIVLPEEKGVIAVQAMVGDMQKEINDVLELFHSITGNSTEPLADFAKKAPEKPKPSADLDCTGWKCEENLMGFTSVNLRIREDEADVIFVRDGREAMTLRAGFGCWKRSELRGKWLRPKLLGLMDAHAEELFGASCCAYDNGQGGVLIEIREHNTVNRDTLDITPDGDLLTLTVGGDGGYDPRVKVLKAKRIR